MPRPEPVHEPHKIKTVRLLSFPTPGGEEANLAEAHFNVRSLTPDEVRFDMNSWGSSAFSQEQMAGISWGTRRTPGPGTSRCWGGRPGGAGAPGSSARPTTSWAAEAGRGHPGPGDQRGPATPGDGRQGRAAPARRGAPDVRDRARSRSRGTWTSADWRRLTRGRPRSSTWRPSPTARPLSLANLKAVRALAERHGARVVLDVSRIMENACFMQRHEPGQGRADRRGGQGTSPRPPTCSQLDGAEDPSANMGGLLATDNPADHERFMNEVVVYEGLHTYGGMAGRTMEVWPAASGRWRTTSRSTG